MSLALKPIFAHGTGQQNQQQALGHFLRPKAGKTREHGILLSCSLWANEDSTVGEGDMSFLLCIGITL